MKNALILHGTSGSSQGNWFPWLKTELEKQDYKVWVPDLPLADKPNIKRYNKFLLSQDFHFSSETILIGHSSGAVAVLGLLQELPKNVVVKKAILVAASKDDLGWESLQELFDPPLDLPAIKPHAKEFIFLHSDNDPYCSLDHAKFLVKKLNGTLHIFPGYKHFNTSTTGEHFTKFPEILSYIS